MSFFLPKEAIDQHIAILGKTGSGKTWTAKLVVEHILKQKRQTCVLDPTGAWYGLRLAADGHGRGFDVVLLGGEHADIPLAERSGAAVARLVTEQGASVVIDTSGFTVGEYTRWFIDFAGTLYTTLRNPLHLVIDEAHYFMPQGKSPDVDAGRMLHAGNRLMSGGRSRGIRGLMVTQRPAKLHKDSLTCADTLIAMRMIAPQDRAAVKEWVDGCGDATNGKQVIDSLAQLKRGEGWVWYPEGGHLKRVEFPAITTYDSSAAPKHGQKSGPVVSTIDLSEVQAAMAESVAEAKANDPKELRAEIARLKAEAAKKPAAAVPDEKAIEMARRTGLHQGMEQERERMRSVFDELEKMRDGIAQTMVKARMTIGTLPKADPRPKTEPVVNRPASEFVRPISSPAENGSLPKGERLILIACADAGERGADRTQITVGTGFKRSTRDAYIQRLREKGFVSVAGDMVLITYAGENALGDYEPLPTGIELRKYWLAKLPKGEADVLGILISQGYAREFDRDGITEKTGFKRSTRDAYLQRLISRKLVVATGSGMVQASEHLFEE